MCSQITWVTDYDSISPEWGLRLCISSHLQSSADDHTVSTKVKCQNQKGWQGLNPGDIRGYGWRRDSWRGRDTGINSRVDQVPFPTWGVVWVLPNGSMKNTNIFTSEVLFWDLLGAFFPSPVTGGGYVHELWNLAILSSDSISAALQVYDLIPVSEPVWASASSFPELLSIVPPSQDQSWLNEYIFNRVLATP